MSSYSVNMTVEAAVVQSVSGGSGFYDMTYDAPGPARIGSEDQLLANGVPSTGDALVTFPTGAQLFVPKEIFEVAFTKDA